LSCVVLSLFVPGRRVANPSCPVAQRCGMNQGETVHVLIGFFDAETG
jgi:hypothetical protein